MTFESTEVWTKIFSQFSRPFAVTHWPPPPFQGVTAAWTLAKICATSSNHTAPGQFLQHVFRPMMQSAQLPTQTMHEQIFFGIVWWNSCDIRFALWSTHTSRDSATLHYICLLLSVCSLSSCLLGRAVWAISSGKTQVVKFPLQPAGWRKWCPNLLVSQMTLSNCQAVIDSLWVRVYWLCLVLIEYNWAIKKRPLVV